MKKLVRSLSFFLSFLAVAAHAELKTITSPNASILVSVDDDQGMPHYSIQFRGEDIVKRSALGLEFKDIDGFVRNLHIVKAEIRSNSSTWIQPWGERKQVKDTHRELVVDFAQNQKPFYHMLVRIKVFDDGVGFRYEVAKQAGLAAVAIVDEKTEFTIPDSDKTTAWWIPGRAHLIDEFLYNTSPLARVVRAQTPMTMKLPSGVHMAIHEAALVDYAAMTLEQRKPGYLRADLTPWYDGIRVKTQTPFVSPWRTIHISANAVGLLNSNLILNLNEPNKLGDVSWVKPGKYLGVWWGMHLGAMTWGTGSRHGATTERTKGYMDFAAQYGFSGVLVEGWNQGWDGNWVADGDKFNFVKASADFNLVEVSRYGKAKGVNLIGHHETGGAVSNYRNQMAEAYDLYQTLGVTQIKTGYVSDHDKILRTDAAGVERNEWHDGQFMVNEYLYSVTEAAKRKISINTHESIKDTGLRRTYPNWISREAARGQEFNAAWSATANPPEHTVLLPFTRLLAGPMDYTPGIFNLAPFGLNSEHRVKHTLAKELALYVVIYSPIQMAADLPENYLEKDGKTLRPGFQFILDVPTDWEQSRALLGEVGDYVAYARKARHGDDWFLGAITDENPRQLSVKLDFLESGKKYTAEIYRDGPAADWKTNPYDIVIERKIVRAKDVLNFNLGASGGVAIRFKLEK
ncbi:MAG TPA: glycoside hydrolase family 97 protein [Cellvibrio sp.]|nr:glycoside hydrolase family 97 protein [Cellvibrio sp.]